MRTEELGDYVDSNTYNQRNRHLIEMGYCSYGEYLKSPLWASIRAKVYSKYGKVCRLCSGKATEIHHLGYGRKVLKGECIKPLVPLCNRCHLKVEFFPDGTKRTLVEAHSTYIKLWEKVKPKRKTYKQEKVKVPKPTTVQISTTANHCPDCNKIIRKNRLYCGKHAKQRGYDERSQRNLLVPSQRTQEGRVRT